MLARRVKTVLSNPKIGVSYADWIFQRYVLRRTPTRVIRGRIPIGEFCNFSEFLAVENFVDDNEFRFYETYPFVDGPLIDIGANIGLISLLLSKRFPDRTVHAIEPSPYTFAALGANLKRNASGNIKSHNIAIADTSGAIPFAASRTSRGTASIGHDGAANTIAVPCLTFDDFCEQNKIDHIALLKVDVEGYETLVFKGAHRTLAAHKPSVILFEVCPAITENAGFNRRGPAEYLLDVGYELRRYDPKGELVPVDLKMIDSLVYENWIAIPKNR